MTQSILARISILTALPTLDGELGRLVIQQSILTSLGASVSMLRRCSAALPAMFFFSSISPNG